MFEQIKLDYQENALAPVLDQETVEVHYGKHHATYTKNFNDAVAKAGLAGKSAEEILANLNSVADEALRTALKNNGGGYYNHNLYFSQFSASPAAIPGGELARQIDRTFGSLDNLKSQLSELAVGQFGSGWAWLSSDAAGELMISKSPNQDNPITEKTGFTPILAIDVWEHAYYLQYKNLRPAYVEAIWQIIDWDKVAANYLKTLVS